MKALTEAYYLINDRLYFVEPAPFYGANSYHLRSADGETRTIQLNPKHKVTELVNQQEYHALYFRTMSLNAIPKDNYVTLEELTFKNPLSSQLSRLTGDGWSDVTFENYLSADPSASAFEGNIIVHKKSQKLFRLPFRKDQL